MADINSTSYSEAPHDTLTYRLMQIGSLIDCLRVTASSTDGTIEISPGAVEEALRGISTLVSQARSAWDTIQMEEHKVVQFKRANS